ncbi:MAG: FapA family protein [bacterium]
MSEKLYDLKLTPRQVLLRVTPPEEGRKANLNDIQKELKSRGISYHHGTLFDIYRRASDELEILNVRESTQYEVVIDIAADCQEATMTIVPPDSGEEKLDPKKIQQAMHDANLGKGILYDVIQNTVKNNIENEPQVIARGKLPVHGKDGKVDFLFQKPEDGEAPSFDSDYVDYKELRLIKNTQEGELIARIHPPTPGADGFNVQGKTLKAKQGKTARIKAGKNVEANEDGTEMHATAGGYVLLADERLSVENVYQVSQVNSDTGNIRFKGVVMVTGSVEDNFSVESEQGIEVTGTVGKATLRSGGDIKVHGGVMGGDLDSKRNISAKFFSEANVHASQNVTAQDYILHSTVEAGKGVRVTKSPTGFINGGLTRAGDFVMTPNLGSDVAEDRTQLEAGMRPNVQQQFDRLSAQIDKGELTFEKVRKNLQVLQRQREMQGPFDEQKQETFQKMIDAARHYRQQLMSSVAEYRSLSGEVAESDPDLGYVFISNIVNAGVTIQIRRQKFVVKTPLKGSGFRLVKGEIKMLDVDEVLKTYKAHYGRLPAPTS